MVANPLPTLAISVRQPWAWAIINAGKDVENRTWESRVRGRVCIHAASVMTIAEWRHGEYFMSFINIALPHRHSLLRGGIIGTAEIVDCVSASESPWFEGPIGFVLRNPRPVDFIPCRGALGFFDWRAAND